MRRVYRTKWHRFLGVAIGLGGGLPYIVLAVQSSDKSWAFRAVGLIVGVAFGSFCILRLARAGVFLTGEGIKIVNLLITRKYSWSEINRFTMGSYSLLSPMGFVELNEGTRVHIWGIQGTASLRNAQKLIDSLNAVAREARDADNKGSG